MALWLLVKKNYNLHMISPGFLLEYFLKNAKDYSFAIKVTKVISNEKGSVYELRENDNGIEIIVHSHEGQLIYDTLKEYFQKIFGIEINSYSASDNFDSYYDKKLDENIPLIAIELFCDKRQFEHKIIETEESYYDLNSVLVKQIVKKDYFWQLREELESRLEALEFLDKYKGKTSGIAFNRFSSKEKAVQFVNSLYEAGATKIEAIDIDSAKHYTDTIEVQMPIETNKRKKIFEVYNNEILKEDKRNKIEEDMGQKVLIIWWD